MKVHADAAVVIIGATSAIARAAAHAFAKQGRPLFLTSRDQYELERIACDIHIRYHVKVNYACLDLDDMQDFLPFFNNVIKLFPNLDGLLMAAGDFGKHNEAIADIECLSTLMQRNFSAPASLISLFANFFAARKNGFIIGISSIAGDRGRQSNYIYGSAKAGFAVFLQGLRSRLHASNVRVITVKLGPVDTAMTFTSSNTSLVASPDMIGRKIANLLKRKRDIVYLPSYWRYIMLMIKCLPERIFKRLKL